MAVRSDRRQRRLEFAPLWVSLAWMVGTFLLFLVVGQVQKVDNLGELTWFIAKTVAFFAAGYWVRMVRYRAVPPVDPVDPDVREAGQIKTLVLLSAVYYVTYALIYMAEYGVASPSAVLAALTDPGSAYLAKFDVYAAQQASGQTNFAAQIITLAAVLSAPLVPFLVLYWKHLTGDLRLLGLLSLGMYVAFFLSIGTLSGLGGILIYAGVSVMVLRARSTRTTGRRRRGLVVVAVLAGLAFASYMSYNQGARISTTGVTAKYAPNPVVERFAGEQFARGLTVTFAYPTHGYQGLAYNLETPRVHWTKLRGSSRAIDSYLEQYGFGESVQRDTYPAHTEVRTGWPAGQLWATIYPWLASDLGWWGAVFFMFGVGWWLARFWHEAVVEGRKLSLLLLCQLGVLIAFVPANNQLGIGRPSVICLATLGVMYGFQCLSRRTSARRNAGRPRSTERYLQRL